MLQQQENRGKTKPNQTKPNRAEISMICYLYIILVIKTKSIVTYILDFFLIILLPLFVVVMVAKMTRGGKMEKFDLDEN